MTLKAYRSIVLGAASLIAIAALTGCTRGAETAQPNLVVNKENAEMRTVVPLTRPIALDKAGEVVNLEFDLPPPGPNAAQTLMLGFRTESPDTATGIALTSKILRADLGAKVRLQRVEEGAVTAVPLSQVTPDQRDWVAVPADGTVPSVTVTSVDTSLLEEAGLLNSKLFQKQFKFAVAERIESGHYRLTVELLADHPELQGQEAELLVAYFKRGK
jgi:hypothetical protein